MTHPSDAQSVVGVVYDPKGQPLAGARVQLVTGHRLPREGKLRGVTTDATGAFHFDFAFDAQQRVRLYASHPSYAPAVTDHVVPGSRPYELHMTHGHVVTVRVIDTRGDPVAVRRVGIELAGLSKRNHHRMGKGVFVFDGLPEGRVRFVCPVGLQRFQLDHDSSIPEARIEVPVLGTASISWPAELEIPESSYGTVRVTQVGGEGALHCGQFHAGSEVTSLSLLLVVGSYRIEFVMEGSGEEEPSKVLAGVDAVIHEGSQNVTLR